MFIELTEVLRCPRDHEESYVICGPVTMDGRDVVRGGIVCPVCRAEYPIIDRIAFFSPPLDEEPPPPPSELTAEAAVAFLGLEGAGGYVVTLGGAGRLASEISALLPKVMIVAVNPPRSASATHSVSIVRSTNGFPLKQRSVRAVIIGADAVRDPWLTAGVGAVLPGLRVIIEKEDAAPAGVVALARGAGVFVGEKRPH